ncbi:MAG: asparaginase [Acidobacteriota bacterium]|nr:asparaginase [Acidobacteriota bacterium]
MPRVLILHTGGTLGMRPREPDRALAPDEIGATILEHVPELSRIATVETRVLFNIDSTDVGPTHWVELARAVGAGVDSFDGIVITHGTDAMAFTASALSYQLRNLPRPVILTGSQRPLADVRSDGRGNLVGAVDLATRDIPEVGIYFDGLLLRGNRATKARTFGFDAFTSPHFGPLAQIGTGLRLHAEPLRHEGPFRVDGGFDTRVGALRLIPGVGDSLLSSLAGSGLRGLVLDALGSGNAPVIDRSVALALSRLIEEGSVVAVRSQAEQGTVDLDRYAGGRLLKEIGAISAADMTFEAAAVKLMYLLGTLSDPAQVENAFVTPLAGEMSL